MGKLKKWSKCHNLFIVVWGMSFMQEKMSKKELCKGILIFAIITCSLLTFSLNDGTFIPSDFKETVVLSSLYGLVVALSLTYSIWKGKQDLAQKRNLRIFYKMPLYSLVSLPLFIIYFFIALSLPQVSLSNKEGMAALAYFFISILSIVLLAFVSFLFSIYYYNVKKESVVPKIALSIAIGIVILELMYLSFLFITLPSTLFCSTARCYVDVALKNKNPTICLQYGPGTDSKECIIQYVLAKNDLSICDTNFQSECYTAVAIKKNTPLICSQIPDTGYLNHNVDQCFLKYAYDTKDTSVCKYIQSDSEKEICLQGMRTKSA